MNSNSNSQLKLKYSQALQGFLLTSQARRLSPHTIRDYTHTLTKFQTFLKKDVSIEDIGARHIEEFLAAQVELSDCGGELAAGGWVARTDHEFACGL